MSERSEKFFAAWAKWKALEKVEFHLVGLCAYVAPKGEVKTGAGLLG